MSRTFFKRAELIPLLAFITVMIWCMPQKSYAASKNSGVIAHISVEPENAITLAEIYSITGLGTGQQFSRRTVKRSVKLLYMTGRFRDIRAYMETDNEHIRLIFRMELHERVGSIIFSGNKHIRSRIIENLLTVQKYDIVDMRQLDRQASSIRELYRKSGYYQSTVEYTITGRGEDKFRDISFQINEGMQASISDIIISENNLIDKEEIRRTLSLHDQMPYEDILAQKAVTRVDKLYRKKKMKGVRINFHSDYYKESNSIVLSIDILEGRAQEKKVSVEKIRFKGNTVFSSSELRKNMLTGRKYSDDVLNSDLEKIEVLYKKHGYISVKIEEKSLLYNDDGTSVIIELTIHEGLMTVIRNLDFEGNKFISDDDLKNAMGVKTGEQFDQWKLEEGMSRIVSVYGRKGYIYAKISEKNEFAEDRSSVDVRFLIDEGIQVTVGNIIIKGNDATEDKVIRRELLVKPGDIYNMDLVYKSQQRVYRLGYLSGVRLTPFEENIVEGRKDLILSVRERKAGSLEVAGGYGLEEGFRGYAELAHRNFVGTGADIRARVDVSEAENTFLIGYKKPWMFDYPFDGRLSVLRQAAVKPSFSLEKYAIVGGVDKEFTDFIRISLQYEYEISRPFDVSEGAQMAPEDKETTNIGTISPIIIRDSRDDIFNPEEGSINSFKVDYSAGMLTGSELEFIKYTFQSSWYFPVMRPVVLGLSARGGWAYSYGKTKEIPITKRFFLGGRTTVRGFELDSIGPSGEDQSPTGGNVFLNLNSELRFPIYRKVGGLVFIDAGNVWLDKETPVDVMDMRSSAGAGLRYLTPIGPFSLDIGWKLNREEIQVDEDTKKRESAYEWHFTIGHVF